MDYCTLDGANKGRFLVEVVISTYVFSQVEVALQLRERVTRLGVIESTERAYVSSIKVLSLEYTLYIHILLRTSRSDTGDSFF